MAKERSFLPYSFKLSTDQLFTDYDTDPEFIFGKKKSDANKCFARTYPPANFNYYNFSPSLPPLDWDQYHIFAIPSGDGF